MARGSSGAIVNVVLVLGIAGVAYYAFMRKSGADPVKAFFPAGTRLTTPLSAAELAGIQRNIDASNAMTKASDWKPVGSIPILGGGFFKQ